MNYSLSRNAKNYLGYSPLRLYQSHHEIEATDPNPVDKKWAAPYPFDVTNDWGPGEYRQWAPLDQGYFPPPQLPQASLPCPLELSPLPATHSCRFYPDCDCNGCGYRSLCPPSFQYCRAYPEPAYSPEQPNRPSPRNISRMASAGREHVREAPTGHWYPRGDQATAAAECGAPPKEIIHRYTQSTKRELAKPSGPRSPFGRLPDGTPPPPEPEEDIQRSLSVRSESVTLRGESADSMSTVPLVDPQDATESSESRARDSSESPDTCQVNTEDDGVVVKTEDVDVSAKPEPERDIIWAWILKTRV